MATSEKSGEKCRSENLDFIDGEKEHKTLGCNIAGV